MNRTILISSLLIFLNFGLYCQQGPLTGPVSEEEVNQFINSEEFEKLFGPMSEEERKQLAQATMQASQELEAMSPQERQKIEQQAEEFMKKQLEAQPEKPEQPLPTPQITQPARTPALPQPTPIKTTAPADSSKLSSIRLLVDRTSELIEDIDLKFESLPRVSSDNILENKWFQIKPDIPFAVATLKAIGKKDQLLEKLTSSEYRLLKDQITGLRNELERSSKNLIAPDSGMLSKLSDADAARAQPLTKQEKKQSKRARNRIIELLHQEIPNISFGIKGLLEKYAPEVLKESKVKMPKTRPSRVTSSGGRSGYGGYSGYDGSGYGRGGYGQGGYDGYTPSYGTDGGDSYTNPSRDLSRFDGKYPTRSARKEEDDKDKDKKVALETKEDKAKQETKKDHKTIKETKPEDFAIPLNREFEKLDKKIKAELFERKTSDAKDKILVGETLGKLQAKPEPKREDLQTARRTLQEINSLFTVDINKTLTKMLRDIKDDTDENQNAAKQEALKVLHTKKNAKKLMKMAKKVAATPAAATASEELKNVRKLLVDFLEGYQAVTIQLTRQELAAIMHNLTELDSTIKAQLIDVAGVKQALNGLADASIVIDANNLAALNNDLKTIHTAIAQAQTEHEAALKTGGKKQKKHQREAFATFMQRAKSLTELYTIAQAIPSNVPTDRKTLADALKKYAEAYKALISVK